MRAMILNEIKKPLELQEVPIPVIGPEQVLIKIGACGVCRTDLHIIDGELTSAKLPLILGHQIVGKIEKTGKNVTSIKVGSRVGVPWLGGSCKKCEFCKSGRENLCEKALYTGYQIDGGYAEYCVAQARNTFLIPNAYSDIHAAPLLCSGLIGFRALRLAGNIGRIGFYGFGSSAHLLTQVVNYKGGEVYAFTKRGDIEGQEFAKKMGAAWSGDTDEEPPYLLDAAIIFAPVGSLIPLALKSVKKGGTVVCAGIHMSDIPSFPYHLLWEERIIRSVANLTHKDGEDFLALAPLIPVKTEVNLYPLEKTNEALENLRYGRFSGSAVIKIS